MKPSSVLLVNPWIYDFAAYDFGIKPLGLLQVASHLRKKCDVSLIDCLSGSARSKRTSGFSKFRKEKIDKPKPLKNTSRPYFRYGIPVDDFREKLLRVEKPHDIYVTSGMTYWYPGVQFAIKILKELFPETPVTLGGIYATLCFAHARRESGADRVCRGEYLDSETDIDSPAYDLLEEKDILPVRLSKGCPNRCSYCASGILSPVFMQRDPLRVFEDIMYCRRMFKTKTFVFYDDALLYNAETGIKKLLRMIAASGEKINFHTPNGLHAKMIDEELAYLLRKTGFRDVRLSLETSDEELQEITGNKVTNRDLKRAVLLLMEAGFSGEDIGIYVLAGAPWLNIEKTKKDILFVNSMGVKAVIASYSPIPGTKDYDILAETGLIEEGMDPLWHNKAIFAERLMPGLSEEIKKLRRFTSAIQRSTEGKRR